MAGKGWRCWGDVSSPLGLVKGMVVLNPMSPAVCVTEDTGWPERESERLFVKWGRWSIFIVTHMAILDNYYFCT